MIILGKIVPSKTSFDIFMVKKYDHVQIKGMLLILCRMNKESFDKILEKIRPYISHPKTHRHPIGPEQRLAITLRQFYELRRILLYHIFLKILVSELYFLMSSGFFVLE